MSTVGRDEASSVTTSGNKKPKTSDWTQSTCGVNGPPSRWPPTVGAALATPLSRFERLTT
jgi:hypothetical protein